MACLSLPLEEDERFQMIRNYSENLTENEVGDF